MSKVLCLFLVVGASTIVAGCGGGVCDRYQSIGQSVATKANPCRTTPLTSVFSLTKQQCDTAINQCSSTDKDAINRALDCFDRLQTCTPATSAQFQAAADACGRLATLSPQCQAAGF